jgi:hypothetical protein
MLTFKFMIFIVVAFIMLYAIIDRICKCIEHKKSIEEHKKLIEEIKEHMDKDDVDINKYIL